MIAPPRLPTQVELGGGDSQERLRFRLWQISWSLVIILATVWLMTLGYIPGVLAVVTAKHLLVAILAMGLGINAQAPHDKANP